MHISTLVIFTWTIPLSYKQKSSPLMNEGVIPEGTAWPYG
jgi:hypothetical protein